MHKHRVLGIIALVFLLLAGGCKKPSPTTPVTGPTPQTLTWSAQTGVNTFVIDFAVSPCVGGTRQLGPTSTSVSCSALPAANGQLLYDGTITVNGGIAMHVKSCDACGTMAESQQTLSWSSGTGMNAFAINFTTSPCIGGTRSLTPTNGVASCLAQPAVNGQLLYDGTITMNGGIAMHVKSCDACGTMPEPRTKPE